MRNPFDFHAEASLASELADRIGKVIPASLLATRRHVLSANRVSRALEEAFAEAKDFDSQRGLGFVRRAVLANRFRWELKGRGFPEDFISVATEGLVVELSRRKKASRPSA